MQEQLNTDSDYERALQLSELQKAAIQCAKGNRYKQSVAGYLHDSLCRNQKLQTELKNGSYHISRYLIFEITEPKQRTIVATRFRDRVWQKSMCNNGVREQLLRGLIYDNGACQKGKGVDFAVDRIICFLQRYYRKHGSNKGFYRHYDIKGYFPNTPHCVTIAIVDCRISDKDFKRHLKNVICSFKDPRSAEEIAADPFGERGTALGSEISQLLQLAVLSHIDHAIKESFRMKYYIRFNDDILLISDSNEELDTVRDYLKSELAKLGLTMTDKCGRGKLEQGIRFMKRRFILTDTGKVIVKPFAQKFAKERGRLRKLKKKLDDGRITITKIENHYQAVRAGLSRCDASSEIKALDRFYEKIIGQKPPEPKRRRKNGYSKAKSQCRTQRRRNRQVNGRKPDAQVRT